MGNVGLGIAARNGEKRMLQKSRIDLNRRDFIGKLLATSVGVLGMKVLLPCASAIPAVGRPDADRPNFILLLTDDQGWCDRSSLADPAVPGSNRSFFHTPNIDRFSKESLNFVNGYSPAPICTPTRRSIQFGMTPARIGGTEFKAPTFDPTGKPTIAQMIKAHDPAYVCAHFGKWGEYMVGVKGRYDDERGDPKKLGYDVTDGFTGNEHGTCDNKINYELHPDQDPKRIFSMTERGIAFLKQQTQAHRPFYLQMSYYAIHRAPQARPDTIAKYQGQLDPKGGETTLNLPPMLDDLDTGIGRLLDAIKQLGLDSNTYIFFGSDNGGAAAKGLRPNTPGVLDRNQPLAEAKHSIKEGGIRTPFMVQGPGVIKNAYCKIPVILTDLYATIHDLLGAQSKLGDDIDSASIKDVLFRGDKGQVERKTPGLVFHYPYQTFHTYSALRIGDYKVFNYWADETWKISKVELFDLSQDIAEKNDLSAKLPALAMEMSGKLTAYLKSVNAEPPKTKEQQAKRGRQERDPDETAALVGKKRAVRAEK